MTDYELQRSRYLCVPGGSIREVATTCPCYPQNLDQSQISGFERSGGTIWKVFRECPEHLARFKTPVWTARMGRLTNRTAASEMATVEIED